MGKKMLMKSGIKPNTFIGGVGATINTPALLATKLGILVSRIKAFKVVGSDIECAIIGNYNIPSSAFYGNSTGITSYNDVEGKVLVLGRASFNSNTNIVSVIFPNCTTIDSVNTATRVFYNCTSLTTVTMPNVTSLGFGSFQGCTAVTYFNFPLVTNLEAGIFHGCSSATFGTFSSLTSIYGDNCFNTCTSATSLSFPLLTSIVGISTFQSCTNLTSIALPSLTSINGFYNFRYCSSLLSISFPELLTWYGYGNASPNTIEGAFRLCTSLTTFSAPKMTVFESNLGFNSCSAITLINMPKCTVLGRVGSTMNNVFYLIKTGCVINVNVYLQTSAAGGTPDEDLVYAISARGATVNYEI